MDIVKRILSGPWIAHETLERMAQTRPRHMTLAELARHLSEKLGGR